MATITKQGQKGNLTKLDLDYEGTKDGDCIGRLEQDEKR